MTDSIQNFFLSSKECVLENPRSFYGCFSLGPFQNSQSLTVANALRRTLLSEIRGVAITYIEIDGVIHEYTNLPGIRESVLDIVLNFKQIVLKKISPFSKPLYGYLNVRGPGIIRASDLKLPPGIQCVDSDQYIATLMENGKLNVKFTIVDFQISLKNQDICENVIPISKFQYWKKNNFSFKIFSKRLKKSIMKNNNKGKFFEQIRLPYVFSFEKNVQKNDYTYNISDTNGKTSNNGFLPTLFPTTKNNQKKNSLWVDPILNPIFKVNYVIENIEPFQKNQPNQIIMIELWTNGSIHPRKAFYDALLYLKIMFEKLDSMKFLNYQLANSIIVSDKVNTKFLHSFENNLTSYMFLEKKNLSFLKQKLFFSDEIKDMQKNYLFEIKQKQKDALLSLSIEELYLPSRILKSLSQHKFQTINDLMKITPQILRTYPGIGNFSILKIQKSLEKIGLIWGEKKK